MSYNPKGADFTIVTGTTTDGNYKDFYSVALAEGECIYFEIEAGGNRTNGEDYAFYIKRIIVRRIGTADASFIGSIDSPLNRDTDNSYDFTLGLSGNDMLFRIKGDNGHNLNWSIKYKKTILSDI